MEIPLLILFAAAPVGALDVLYFHLWKFRLYQRPQSVKEETTHILRGVVVPIITIILLLGRPEGSWFWAVALLFGFDSFNALLDVVFEPASRRPDIVPPPELALHFVGITMMGAAWATFMVIGWPLRNSPTALMPHAADSLAGRLFAIGWPGLAGAFGLVLFETILFLRARALRHE